MDVSQKPPSSLRQSLPRRYLTDSDTVSLDLDVLASGYPWPNPIVRSGLLNHPLVKTCNRVCQIKDGEDVIGAAFVVGPHLLMTTESVLSNQWIAENYEAHFQIFDPQSEQSKVEFTFPLDPKALFIYSPRPSEGEPLDKDHLDYVIIAVSSVGESEEWIFDEPLKPSDKLSVKKEGTAILIEQIEDQETTISYAKKSVGQQGDFALSHTVKRIGGTPILDEALLVTGLNRRRETLDHPISGVNIQKIISDLKEHHQEEIIDYMEKSGHYGSMKAWGIESPEDIALEAEALYEEQSRGALLTFRKAADSYRHARPNFLGCDESLREYTFYRIGRAYHEGEEVKPDLDKAIKWYKRAGKKLFLRKSEHARKATYRLAMLYLEGSESIRNSAKAVTELKRAAQAHHIPSQYQLGLCYYQGLEGEFDPNYTEAVKQLKRPANAEYKEAVYYLECARFFEANDGSMLPAISGAARALSLWGIGSMVSYISPDTGEIFTRAARETKEAMIKRGQKITKIEEKYRKKAEEIDNPGVLATGKAYFVGALGLVRGSLRGAPYTDASACYNRSLVLSDRNQ